MPTSVTQLPWLEAPAQRSGKRMWRKQILPIGDVEHPRHGVLSFTTERLAAIRDRFLQGAQDAVPFVLVNDQNEHSSSPDLARGQIRGLELTDSGLEAIVETSERGTQLLMDAPELPVSVRLSTPEAGPFKGQEILEHLAGTFSPVARGLTPWAAIDASADVVVTDFSDGGCYRSQAMDPSTPATPDPTTAADALSTEETGFIRSLMNKMKGTPAEPQTPAASTATPPAEPADQVLTDADVTALLAAIPAEAEPATPGTEPAMAGASLSDDDRATLDLAVQSNLRYGTSQIASRLDGYVTEGVPPALVNGARAVLIGDGITLSDDQKAIAMDFANGREPAAVKALFATLDAAKGTIDFAERGSDLTRLDTQGDREKQMQKEADDLASRYI